MVFYLIDLIRVKSGYLVLLYIFLPADTGPFCQDLVPQNENLLKYPTFEGVVFLNIMGQINTKFEFLYI